MVSGHHHETRKLGHHASGGTGGRERDGGGHHGESGGGALKLAHHNASHPLQDGSNKAHHTSKHHLVDKNKNAHGQDHNKVVSIWKPSSTDRWGDYVIPFYNYCTFFFYHPYCDYDEIDSAATHLISATI